MGYEDFLEVARIGDFDSRSSWTFAGSAEAYPRDDLRSRVDVVEPDRRHPALALT